ncbi:hypothetical protein FMEXI_9109 [Fusarium mexicanum]|uniref:Uncharacterized protein n=1 Tax=Fusarium mexicanum TaxID=751941 RepID=A0A8H5MT43_9HYPO|nr:hypothetical protein FMEXI_9109 [Fusarium mexicanum]
MSSEDVGKTVELDEVIDWADDVDVSEVVVDNTTDEDEGEDEAIDNEAVDDLADEEDVADEVEDADDGDDVAVEVANADEAAKHRYDADEVVVEDVKDTEEVTSDADVEDSDELESAEEVEVEGAAEDDEGIGPIFKMKSVPVVDCTIALAISVTSLQTCLQVISTSKARYRIVPLWQVGAVDVEDVGGADEVESAEEVKEADKVESSEDVEDTEDEDEDGRDITVAAVYAAEDPKPVPAWHTGAADVVAEAEEDVDDVDSADEVVDNCIDAEVVDDGRDWTRAMSCPLLPLAVEVTWLYSTQS